MFCFIVQFFNAIDKYKDQALSWSELYGFDIDRAVVKFPDIFDLPGQVIEDEDEDVILYTEEEWHKIEIEEAEESLEGDITSRRETSQDDGTNPEDADNHKDAESLSITQNGGDISEENEIPVERSTLGKPSDSDVDIDSRTTHKDVDSDSKVSKNVDIDSIASTESTENSKHHTNNSQEKRTSEKDEL